MLEVFAWYLLITLLGWLVFPISFRLLKFLPERGFTIIRPLALLLWGYMFWLLASLGVLANDTGGALFALLLIAALSCGAAWGKFGELRQWIKTHARLIVTAEVVFALAFAAWAFVRAANPQILNTEKPMELAFINSILRSPSFPPADPWLSDYAISYYYFGYVMVSLLVRLTGTATLVAFNISIALWYALTAVAAYGLAYNLLHWFFERRKPEKAAVHRKALSWAILAPVFILLLGNMSGILELFHSGGVGWTQQADGSYTSSFWSWLDISTLNEAPPTPFNWQPHRGGWSWWAGSRVLKDYDLQQNSQEIIDEFPFFSYLLADMHPHVLGMPFTLLAMMLALNLFYRGANEPLDDIHPLSLLRRPEAWLAGLTLGGLSFLNTWDFPIYVGLYAAVFTYVRFRQTGWQKKRWGDFLGMGILLGVAGIFLYLPFYIGFASQAGGFLPSGVFFTRGVQFWVMFAPFLVPICLWLGLRLRAEKQRSTWVNGLKFGAAVVFGLWLLMILALLFVNVAQVAGQGLALSTNAGLAQFGAKINQYAGQLFAKQGGTVNEIILTAMAKRFLNPGAWITLLLVLAGAWSVLTLPRRHSSEPVSAVAPMAEIPTPTLPNPQAFVGLLILLGAGLAIFPEFFYLLDGFGWRMNTIFKFYFQTWILWGVAASFGFAVLWEEVSGRAAWIIKPLLSVTLAAACMYPMLMLPAKIQDAQGGSSSLKLTLNGRASYYSDDDMASFEWLANADYGVVLEATGAQYRSDFARASTFSGLPTILGWAGHEGQWRGGYTEIGSRDQDIKTMYETASWEDTQALLSRYNVRYIYIGQSERSAYRVNEDKFISHLAVVYFNSSVVIYEAPDYDAFSQIDGN